MSPRRYYSFEYVDARRMEHAQGGSSICCEEEERDVDDVS